MNLKIVNSTPLWWIFITTTFFHLPNPRIFQLFAVSNTATLLLGIGIILEWAYHGRNHLGFHWAIYCGTSMVSLVVLVFLVCAMSVVALSKKIRNQHMLASEDSANLDRQIVVHERRSLPNLDEQTVVRGQSSANLDQQVVVRRQSFANLDQQVVVQEQQSSANLDEQRSSANLDKQLVVQEIYSNDSFDDSEESSGDQTEIILASKASSFSNEKLVLKRSFSLPLVNIQVKESKISRNFSF